MVDAISNYGYGYSNISMNPSPKYTESKSQEVSFFDSNYCDNPNEIIAQLTDFQNAQEQQISDNDSELRNTNNSDDSTESSATVADASTKDIPTMEVESCATMAYNDTESSCCEKSISLSASKNMASNTIKTAQAAAINTSAEAKTATQAAEQAITVASAHDDNISIANSETAMSEKGYFGITTQQKKADINAHDTQEFSSQNIEQTAQKSAGINGLVAAATPSSSTEPGGGLEDSGTLAFGTETAAANTANMQTGASTPFGNFAAVGGNQLAGADAQNGSWTGSFVKENTGWSAAYTSEATSVAEHAAQNVNTSSIANAQIISGSFGSLTGFMGQMAQIDGMTVPMGNMGDAMMGIAMGAATASSSEASAAGASIACASSSSSAGSSSSSSVAA